MNTKKYLVIAIMSASLLFTQYGCSNKTNVADQEASTNHSNVDDYYKTARWFKLGNMYRKKKDYVKAVEFYDKACYGGGAKNVKGCSSLGFMYANGYGVEKDSTKATKLYEKACDGGDTIGCLNYLGTGR